MTDPDPLPSDAAPAPPTASVTVPAGFRAVGHTCGVKASGRRDLTIVAADAPCAAAGLFTTNAFQGAAVLVGRRHLSLGGGRARAIVCNSGNANVVRMGPRGTREAEQMCEATGAAIGCRPEAVLPASTGIIGRPLPIRQILEGIREAAPRLATGPEADTAAAEGILTTDLVIKTTVRRFQVDDVPVTIGGIAKGSGMIAPSMATMLGFLTTDVSVAPATLQAALEAANAATFNRISVDSDTSTSDTLYVLASGLAGHAPIEQPRGEAYEALVAGLTRACAELADAIVRDGEGATRVFEVEVLNAASMGDADRVGRAITESPLVKTAIHSGNPNWGRFIMAAGKSGARLDPTRFTLRIEGTTVFADGEPRGVDAASLAAVEAKMQTSRVRVQVDLHQGEACATWTGCDLTRDYIRINADYTT